MKMANKKIRYLTTKMLLLVLIVLLPLNLILIYSTQKIFRAAEEQVDLTVQNLTEVYMNRLDMDIQQIDYYLYKNNSENTDFITLRETEDEITYINTKQKVFQEMTKEMMITSNVESYFVYVGKWDDYVISTTPTIKRQDLLSVLEQDMQPLSWRIVKLNEGTYLYKIIKLRDAYYGAFIDLEKIIDEISTSLNYESSEINFVSNDPVSKKEGYLLTATESERANIELTIQISTREIFKNLSYWEKGQMVIAILLLSLIPIMYFVIQKWMLIPLKQLNSAHRELEIGNEDYRIAKEPSSVEFQEAFFSFNKMANNIHSLKLEKIEKELLEKKLMLNNLQLQIRPHFLMNTFNLIFNLASEGKDEGIKELVLYLSAYFRHIYANGDELVVFSKETELIEGYIQAAKIRYSDKVEISYHIDPDVYLVGVPPLLIHNFIENIVNHGMKGQQVIHIMLSAEYYDGQVVFMISDDGNGMSQELVGSINEEKYFVDNDRTHLGILNSAMRLKHFYGSAASIQVESELGSGTVFTISFPYALEV